MVVELILLWRNEGLLLLLLTVERVEPLVLVELLRLLLLRVELLRR